MTVDSSLISFVLKKPETFQALKRAGINEDYFTDDYRAAWKWINRQRKDHGVTPSVEVFETRFSHLDLTKVKARDLPILLAEIKKRRKYLDFLQALEQGSRVNGPDEIDSAIHELQQQINALSLRDGRNGMIDLFSKEAKKRILKDQTERRRKEVMGLPTGLQRFDLLTGGLQRGRLITIIGRTGSFKSWLDLLFVASGVMKGAKVGLYPLEMTVEETALRLYSIFSCRMFNGKKILKNTDLSSGKITKAKIVKFLNLLEDKYAGQLYLADIGSMRDPYTVDRVEAEHEAYNFDMQWIDYLTLMKAPGTKNGEDYVTVRALSSGCKQIALRHDTVVGVSAQVNRQAISSGGLFLPRLEHISYGDSIGHDSDQVISLGKRDGDLYYALVKNRHGPEIGKTRLKQAVNNGQLEDDAYQENEDNDD